MSKLHVIAAALVVSLFAASSAAADTPRTPVTTGPYASWLGTASGFVPQPHDLAPGVHHHVVGSPCGNGVWGCTDGWGEIWICNCRVTESARAWQETFQHEVGHNVQAQEMSAGHYQHFADLVGHSGFNGEAWAEVYAHCAMGDGWTQSLGITYSEYLSVCGWLERAEWGMRYG